MATYRIDSQFTIVSTERGYDVYFGTAWIADCTTREEADEAIHHFGSQRAERAAEFANERALHGDF